MPAQQLLPRVVTDGLGQPGRIHDVGEQEGAEGARGRLVEWRSSDVEVDGGAELRHRAGGCLELEASAGVVPVGRQGPGEQDARLGGFVGGVDLAPGANALLQRGDRTFGVAAMERQLSTRHGDCCRRSGCAQPSSQLLELGGALAGRLVIAHCEARADEHREQEDPSLSRKDALVGERPGEAAHRSPGVALCQQQASPPGLAVVTERKPLARVPPRRQPGRRDGPGCPPARCNPRLRCSG